MQLAGTFVRVPVPRAAIVLSIALPLAAADLVLKHFATTPSWAYHPRGISWLVLSCCLMAGALVAARFSSLARRPGGRRHGGRRPRQRSLGGVERPGVCPIRSSSSRRTRVIAFNLADIFASTGILALMSVLAATLIRNRHLLPTHEEAKRIRRQLLRRRQ